MKRFRLLAGNTWVNDFSLSGVSIKWDHSDAQKRVTIVIFTEVNIGLLEPIYLSSHICRGAMRAEVEIFWSIQSRDFDLLISWTHLLKNDLQDRTGNTFGKINIFFWNSRWPPHSWWQNVRRGDVWHYFGCVCGKMGRSRATQWTLWMKFRFQYFRWLSNLACNLLVPLLICKGNNASQTHQITVVTFYFPFKSHFDELINSDGRISLMTLSIGHVLLQCRIDVIFHRLMTVFSQIVAWGVYLLNCYGLPGI